ncbi:serine/threonine protein kinase [Phycisphaerae bacterium RAS2]|nr:serine/threonine protein kinase [Phycisphaerae bacterium RAS2]
MAQHAHKSPPSWLRALGRNDLPESLSAEGRAYRLFKTFKHDFFAATGLYQSENGHRIIYKVGRVATLMGIPLSFIGRYLARHEARLYTAAQGIEGVPRFLGRYEKTGILHDYVEGAPLSKDGTLADDFFPRLEALLGEIHRRGIAYVDLEKRENILLGDDGRPHLIDFQISWRTGDGFFGRSWPARRILATLQSADRYHLYKHWRRMRPDQLNPAQIDETYQAPVWIRWHRFFFRPLTLLRRQILVWLGARDSARVRSPG